VKGEKRYAIAFDDARNSVAYDSELNKEVETMKIKVLFSGLEEKIDLKYSSFMALPKVAVEVESVREKDSTRSEGEVVHKKTGKLIDREVISKLYFFTVKLPNGNELEIEGKIANA